MTANDGAGPYDGDNGPNALQNFPVLSVAASGGGTTVFGSLRTTAGATATIEFFATPAADADPTGYGEARTYLGAVTITDGGAGDVDGLANGIIPISATFPTSVAIGDSVTATATVNGRTSEFAQNSTVVAASAISGTVYEDVNGDANRRRRRRARRRATSSSTSTTATSVANGADDVLVATTVTAGGGNWSFAALPNGRYWVVVDSRDDHRVCRRGGARQRLGRADLRRQLDDRALDLGARYGGRNAAVSDNAAALATAEHVARVQVAGANVTGVDSGFSFSAIVNTRGDALDDDGGGGRLQQGTLRQFLLNSNSINGVQTSAFAIAGAGVQTITLSTALPDITERRRPRRLVRGRVPGHPGLQRPAAHRAERATRASIYGLHLVAGSSGSTIRGFVINRATSDGIGIDFSNGNLIQGNYIGTNAAGTATAGFGNGDDGIDLDNGSSNNTIGGTLAATAT